jgi:hypothetical protein
VESRRHARCHSEVEDVEVIGGGKCAGTEVGQNASRFDTIRKFLMLRPISDESIDEI